MLTFSQDAATYVLQRVVDVVGALDDGAGAVAVALDEERTRWFPGVRVRSVLEADARRDPLGARLAHARTGRAVLVLLVLTWNEGSVLFNDAINTFYLRLYGVRHMVKDHSDSEKGNPLPPHGLLLPINSKGSFICTIPQRR